MTGADGEFLSLPSKTLCLEFIGDSLTSAEEQRQLDWLEQRPYTTLFISGNHECAAADTRVYLFWHHSPTKSLYLF